MKSGFVRPKRSTFLTESPVQRLALWDGFRSPPRPQAVPLREFADGVRGMWRREPQTALELSGFDQALKGPPKIDRF